MNIVDYQNIDFREVIKNSRNIKVKVRAYSVKFLCDYIKLKNGEDGLRKVKDFLKNYGYDIDSYYKLSGYSWISLEISNVIFSSCIKIFKWNEKDIIKAGQESFSMNVLMKIYMKYFLSVKETFYRTAKIWNKYFTKGEIKIISLDEKKKEVIFQLLDFRVDPVICLYFKGQFSRIVELATGSTNVKVVELKCLFTGSPYHEYKITW